MSRVPKAETQVTPETATTGTAISTATTGGALASIDLTKAFAAPSQEEKLGYLPVLKIAYPVELNQRGITAGDIYHMGLSANGTFTRLTPPTLVVALANRDAVRRLVAGEKGDDYDMAFGICMSVGTSTVKLAQMLADMGPEKIEYDRIMATGDKEAAKNYDKKRIKRGTRWLCAVFHGEKVAFVTVDAFGASENYFGKPLTQGKLAEKRGVMFKLDDHTCNLKTSGNNKSWQYLDPNKHSQWEAVELTDDQKLKILTAWEVEKSKVEAWLKA